MVASIGAFGFGLSQVLFLYIVLKTHPLRARRRRPSRGKAPKAGMDAAFAGALPHLRDAAADQLTGRPWQAMTTPFMSPDAARADRDRAANRRTALTLVSIAVVFFAGIIASQYVGGTTIGIAVLGFGIIGFLRGRHPARTQIGAPSRPWSSTQRTIGSAPTGACSRGSP